MFRVFRVKEVELMKRRRWLAGIIVGLISPLLLLAGCQALPSGWGQKAAIHGETVRVSRVVSGQTLEVLIDGSNQAVRMRLLGIESPGWKQEPWDSAAKSHLSAWLDAPVSSAMPARTVVLESDRELEQKYPDGTTIRLAYAWRDDQLLNETLVAEGLVLANVRSPNTKYEQRLTRAQEKARLLGLGIWNPQNPMRLTPYEFRKQQGT